MKMKTPENHNDRLERVIEVVDFYRGMVLDIAEHELGTADSWHFVRGRLLKALGDRGLTGKIRDILSGDAQ
jgi:hypothetical protein